MKSSMARFLKKYTLIICAVLMSACSLIGVGEWNAYKVTIEIRDSSNQLIPNSEITSTADEIIKSKAPGTFSLLYAKTGLQVVTISAPKKQTKQIKVSIPADQDKIFSVTLNDN